MAAFRALRQINVGLVGVTQGRPRQFAPSRESTAIETVIRASGASRRGREAIVAGAVIICAMAGLLALAEGPIALALTIPAVLALSLVHAMPMLSRDGENVRIRAPGLDVHLSPSEIEAAVVRARWGNHYWFRLPDRLGEPPFYVYVEKRDL